MSTAPTTGKRRAEPCIVEVLGLAPGTDRIIYPWTQQAHEPHQAYEAFRLYLRTPTSRGRRSIRRTAELLGKSRQLLERWSVRWAWGARCAYHDQALDRLRVALRMVQIEEQAARVARELEAMRYIALPVRGREALDGLLSDGDFLLHAALVLPYEDLTALLGAPLGGVGQKGSGTGTETRKCPDPWLGSELGRSTARGAEEGSVP